MRCESCYQLGCTCPRCIEADRDQLRTTLAQLKADLRTVAADINDRRCHSPGCKAGWPTPPDVPCTCGLVEKVRAAAARIEAFKEGE